MVSAAAIEDVTDRSRENILILNSYHTGYVWSDGELKGAIQTLGEKKAT